MPGLILWKNQEMDRLKKDIDRLFDRLWDDFGMPLHTRAVRDIPFIDLSETNDTLMIRAEIPGMDAEDLDISITDNILTIKGELKKERIEINENVHKMERSYGMFSRSIQLPCKIKIDDVKATYKKGILHLVMPKCSPDESPPIQIKVK